MSKSWYEASSTILKVGRESEKRRVEDAEHFLVECHAIHQAVFKLHTCLSSSCLEEYPGRLGSWGLEWGCWCELNWKHYVFCACFVLQITTLFLICYNSSLTLKYLPPLVHLRLKITSHLGKGLYFLYTSPWCFS